MGELAPSRPSGPSADDVRRSLADSPSPLEVGSALLSLPGIAALRRAPEFRTAARQLAEGFLTQDDGLDPHTRWLVRDGGRSLLYGTTLMVRSVFGRVTVADLHQAAALSKLCSPGRVIAFVDYAVDAGQIGIPPGEEVWTRRPLELRPPFWRYGEARLWSGMEAAGLLEPEPPPDLPVTDRRPGTIAALDLMARLLGANPHLKNGRSQPLGVVLDQHGGLNILYDWLLQQPPGQDALLHRVRLNKSALSRRHRVSRPHLSHMVAALEAAGLVLRPEEDVILVSSGLSEDLERHFAQGLQLLRAQRLAAEHALRPHAPSGPLRLQLFEGLGPAGARALG